MGGSIRHARAAGCDAVICGHVHHAEVMEMEGMEYVNSGCWTEKPPTYLTVLHGRVEIRRSDQEADRSRDTAGAGARLSGGILQPAGEAWP